MNLDRYEYQELTDPSTHTLTLCSSHGWEVVSVMYAYRETWQTASGSGEPYMQRVLLKRRIVDADVWCVSGRDGWCACAINEQPAEGENVPTLCGYTIILPVRFRDHGPVDSGLPRNVLRGVVVSLPSAGGPATEEALQAIAEKIGEGS